MTIVPTEERTCRFPGCTRTAMLGEPGVGRPPEYCDDPTHTRASAWRARQRLRAEGAADSAESAHPVDTARQRAGVLTGQVSGMMEHLGQQLNLLVEELRTIGDPDAAAAQMEAVTSEATEQTSAANARASRAEQSRRRAEAERDEADAAAAEATANAEDLSSQVVALTAEVDKLKGHADQLRADLAATRASLEDEKDRATRIQADLDDALAEAAHAARTRDAAVLQAQEQGKARADADIRAATATARADAETARATKADEATTQARRAVETGRVELDAAREATAQLRSDIAKVTAERDAARVDVDRERSHAEERVQDLHTTYARQITDLRAELDKPRTSKSPRSSGGATTPGTTRRS